MTNIELMPFLIRANCLRAILNADMADTPTRHRWRNV